MPLPDKCSEFVAFRNILFMQKALYVPASIHRRKGLLPEDSFNSFLSRRSSSHVLLLFPSVRFRFQTHRQQRGKRRQGKGKWYSILALFSLGLLHWKRFCLVCTARCAVEMYRYNTIQLLHLSALQTRPPSFSPDCIFSSTPSNRPPSRSRCSTFGPSFRGLYQP